MRVSLIVALVLSAALVHAGPVPDEENGTGSKTFDALRNFFSPVTNYFSSIPSKTPSDIADDVRGGVDNVRDWANENTAIQTLRDALNPVRDWIKEKATVVKDQTFSDMYDNVKSSVQDLDQRVGTWLDEHTN